MTEHTPGPWRVGSGFPDCRIFARAVSVYIAKVNAGPCTYEANARLIASAPDLLAALESVLEYVPDECAVDARAAIAKARGQ